MNTDSTTTAVLTAVRRAVDEATPAGSADAGLPQVLTAARVRRGPAWRPARPWCWRWAHRGPVRGQTRAGPRPRRPRPGRRTRPARRGRT
jgi:hypothetical protein